VVEIVSSYDAAKGYGLRVVDLGGVVELKHPSRFEVHFSTERVVARELVRADSILIRGAGRPAVELPKLERLSRGTFGDPNTRL
jgi:hypothetical protein